MILQLTGVIFIMGAAVWIGAYFMAKEKYRIQELEELERSVLLMQSQIQYLSAPLPEILESISWKTEGSIGEAFQMAAERMEKRDGVSAEKIWKEVWQEKAAYTYLTKADLDAILLFGKTLGYLDKEQQEGSIHLLLRYIHNSLAQGNRCLEKNGRLYFSISSLSGLLIIVTLL